MQGHPQAQRQVAVKICGLSTPTHVQAAVQAGARYVGFVFFPKSPRHIANFATARDLTSHVPAGVVKVALVVNPTDAELDALLDQVPIDMLQLHGSEDAARITQIKARSGLPVMKAVGIADRDDVKRAVAMAGVADQLLLDAKPDPKATLPGGNGVAFDWGLIRDQKWLRPWMLAGGLTVDTVGRAIAMTHATQVDVSSGVERAPGVKDPQKIAEFIAKAQIS